MSLTDSTNSKSPIMASQPRLQILFSIVLLDICYTQHQTINRDVTNDSSEIKCEHTIGNQTITGCNINCNAEQSCANNSIICPAQPNSECIIYCNGISSCKNTEIFYNTTSIISNLSMILFCNETESCTNITVNAPQQSNVTIYCNNNLNGDNQCTSMLIDAADSNFGLV